MLKLYKTMSVMTQALVELERYVARQQMKKSFLKIEKEFLFYWSQKLWSVWNKNVLLQIGPSAWLCLSFIEEKTIMKYSGRNTYRLVSFILQLKRKR